MRVAVVKSGSASLLEFTINQGSLLTKSFSIAASDASVNPVVARTHSQLGLNNGLSFGTTSSYSDPISLTENQNQSIIIVEGINDVVPLV